MADPLSVAASVVGITTAAIQSVHFLSTTVDNIKGAPDAIRNIRVDLKAIESALQNLETAFNSNDQTIDVTTSIQSAVKSCESACSDFQTQLQRWMRHSSEDRTFWMDRWKVGLFGQERVKTLKSRLNDCKGTLTIALSTASIIKTTRQEYIMKEMKDDILQKNENIIQKEIARANEEKTESESSLQALSDLDLESIRSGEESEQARQDLMRELKEQQASNDTFQQMCAEAIAKTVYERTGQKIRGVKATDKSHAIAGFIINNSEKESRIEQDISDVTADNQSFAGAGVFKNFNFKDLQPQK